MSSGDASLMAGSFRMESNWDWHAGNYQKQISTPSPKLIFNSWRGHAREREEKKKNKTPQSWPNGGLLLLRMSEQISELCCVKVSAALLYDEDPSKSKTARAGRSHANEVPSLWLIRSNSMARARLWSGISLGRARSLHNPYFVNVGLNTFRLLTTHVCDICALQGGLWCCSSLDPNFPRRC